MLTSVRTSLFLFSMLVLSTGFSHAATAQIPPAPINNIGAAATKMASGKGFEIQQTTDGYQLSCRMQSMYADVTAKGVAIRSLAGKGSGTFLSGPNGSAGSIPWSNCRFLPTGLPGRVMSSPVSAATCPKNLPPRVTASARTLLSGSAPGLGRPLHRP